jgi:hypothetical protein
MTPRQLSNRLTQQILFEMIQMDCLHLSRDHTNLRVSRVLASSRQPLPTPCPFAQLVKRPKMHWIEEVTQPQNDADPMALSEHKKWSIYNSPSTASRSNKISLFEELDDPRNAPLSVTLLLYIWSS